LGGGGALPADGAKPRHQRALIKAKKSKLNLKEVEPEEVKLRKLNYGTIQQRRRA
jgi:hypothetical protein